MTPDNGVPPLDPAGAAILSAATDLVTAGGLDGFSMDALAQLAHVSKTTIYKRWPSRDDLILDVCAQLSAPGPAPDTGTTVEDLRIILTHLCELLNSPLSPVMAALADGAERDEALNELMHTIATRARIHLLRVLAEGIERGELAPVAEPEQLADLLVGPLFYRRFFRRAPVDVQQVMCVAEGFLAGRAAPKNLSG